MAKLTDADMKAILGPDYKERELTEENRADLKAEKQKSMRNTLIGLAVLATIVLIAVFYAGGR